MSAVSFLLEVTLAVILVGSCVCTTCLFQQSSGGGGYYLNSMYCRSGCCGDLYYNYCCYPLTVGGVIGIVLACLLAVSLFIGIVICVFCIRRNRNQNNVTMLQHGQGPIMVQNPVTGLQNSPYPQQQYIDNPAFNQQYLQPNVNPDFNQQAQEPQVNPGFSQQYAQANDKPGFSQQIVQLHDNPDFSQQPAHPNDKFGVSKQFVQLDDNPEMGEQPVQSNDRSDVSE